MAAITDAGVFDESGLLARAREGDAAAFSELVNQYSRKIYRLAKHITQNDSEEPKTCFRRLSSRLLST